MGAEKNFENTLKKYLKKNNIFYVKYFANAYTVAGVPDILACYEGKFLAIEVKAENGRLSELQKVKLQEIAEAGGIAVVLYPSGFDLFKKYFDGGYLSGYSVNIFMHDSVNYSL